MGREEVKKQNAKSFWVVLTMILSLLVATDAWAQYGLYGSPSVPSYPTQQPTTTAQQAVVYPPVQQQPIPPQPVVTGPSLVAPANQTAVNMVPQPQYTQQLQTQQYPQAVSSAPVYQPSTQPVYPSYTSTNPNYQNVSTSPKSVASYYMPGVTRPAVQTNPQYSPVYQQQTPMYSMPTAPRFGSPQAAAPAPSPQLPNITPVTPQRLNQQPVVSLEKISPQPIAEPEVTVDAGVCCETTCDATCETGTCCEPCCEPCCPWFVSVSGLVLGRDQANRVWTSYQANREANQIMNTQDIEMSWAGGGEITFGRSFCCGAYGIEATYWQLAQVTGHASITNPNGVSTPLDMRYLVVGPSGAQENMSDLFDNALEHRLRRSNEAYNVEVNALYYGQPGQGFCGHTFNWLVGARFLKFDDDLLFSSLESGSWEASGGINEGYLGDKVENYLAGVQIGFQARSPQWNRFSTFLTTKFGIYNNHIKNDFMLYRGDGYDARVQPASGVSGSYPVHSTANVFSTVAEVNIGLEWNFSSRLSAGVGYRVIAISGIGLADNQIPFYIVDIPEIERIDCNGDLILHGAFASLTYGF